MARTGKPAARRVESVARALAVLDVLAEAGEALGTNEIARRSGINASSVSRLLATLVSTRVVEHDESSGRYRLGLRLVQLGNLAVAGIGLRDTAAPELRGLVRATGETATLSVPGERDAVTVDFVQSPASVQSVARVGRPSVGHATAAGKVMLAFGGAALPPGRLRRYASRTMVDRVALAAELDRVRVQGWAQAVREREEDLSALAAPIRGPRFELAAILGVQGPASRFDERAMQAAVAPLLDHAERISRRLGWAARRDTPELPQLEAG
jgi:DNA-binding IclR family transcriptional regulator